MIREMKGCFLGFTLENVERSIESYTHQNVRFHNLIIQASQNRKLITIIQNSYDQMVLVCLHAVVLPGRARKSLAEHRNILQLFERRRAELAGKHLRAHIRDLRKAVLNLSEITFLSGAKPK